MNSAEKLEELLSSKSFDELTPAERELVLHELGSEEQYEAMRKIGVTWFKKTAGLSPDPKILKALQHQMTEQKKSSFLVEVLAFRMPAYAAVMLILFFSAAVWIMSERRNSPSTPRAIVKTDTVFLTAKPDTIFSERIIYRYVKRRESFPQSLSRTAQTEPEKNPEIRGVSMKESEVLETLLVSGSK